MAELSPSVPPRGLLLLALALTGALIPHVSYLPGWLYVLSLLVVGWRTLVWLGRVRFPGKIVRGTAVVLATIAIVESSGRQMSLEAAGAFLVAAALLKVLEVSRRRDAVVLIYLVFFLQAAGFLFHQGIEDAAIGLVTIFLAVAAMVAVQASGAQGLPSGLPVLKPALSVMLVSIPFMLVLYFLFPRFAPLWSVALQSEKTLTALAEQMAPGDIASLSQSSGLAFRVTFERGQPQRSELYWRAMILDHYDGRTWRDSGKERESSPARPAGDARFQYEVILEPTGQRYLPSLVGAGSDEGRIRRTDAGLLRHRSPVYQKLRYVVGSTGMAVTADLDDEALHRYLHLPEGMNPRSVEWASEFTQDLSAQEFAEKLALHFSSNAYFYTLKPSRYGRNDIDEFLFEGRRGFCAHYASATAFVARAVGIPARVVTGYQGGEWHPDGYLTVRQYDAHAWVELWDGERWLVFDPTAAVSPLRIEHGLERAVEEEGTFLTDQPLSPLRFRGIDWLNRLRLEMESLNYYWNRWVLSYDGRRQNEFLRNWLGLKDFAEGLYVLAGSIAVMFGLAMLVLWWRQREEADRPLVSAWKLLRERCESLGVEAPEGLTLGQLLALIATRLPALHSEAMELRHAVDQTLYAGAGDENLLARKLRRFALRIRPGAEATAAGNINKRPI